MQLNEYVTLGRSGLLVSPLALGTMTFGNDRWGSDDAESKKIFDRYVEAGGNFVDVADVYAEGKSEEVLGRFIAEGEICTTGWWWRRSSPSTRRRAIPTQAAMDARTSIAPWKAHCDG